MKINEITCKTACSKVNGLPYDWDLNVYRGCEHGCKYCFAQYSHQYINSNNYFDEIFVKTNIIEVLEKQLRSPNWKKHIINLGGVTDNYQPAEDKYKLMPEILKLMIKYKNPIIISSKSDLILRDYDLIAELANLTYVNIVATITAYDEKIRKQIEPNGVSSEKRFAMLKEFRKTNVSVGMHVMPVIPFITDNYENLNCLFEKGKEIGIHYALVQILNLRGPTKATFLNFIAKSYPNLYNPLLSMYKTGWICKGEYKENLYKMVFEIRKKYNITSNYNSPMKDKMKQQETVQLSLFT